MQLWLNGSNFLQPGSSVWLKALLEERRMLQQGDKARTYCTVVLLDVYLLNNLQQ